MQPTPLTGTATFFKRSIASWYTLMMQPAPLMGTVALCPRTPRSTYSGGAAHTPHGDGNRMLVGILSQVSFSTRSTQNVKRDRRACVCLFLLSGSPDHGVPCAASVGRRAQQQPAQDAQSTAGPVPGLNAQKHVAALLSLLCPHVPGALIPTGRPTGP